MSPPPSGAYRPSPTLSRISERCPRGDGRACQTDDERNSEVWGWPVPADQDGWLCCMCAEAVSRA